ncbi:head-tail adaptor protein [Metabacillus halosaccharovorans]|uniref:phage head completion protein n=1 Tax=Metabacillus halosaccharovorans TaxID=930124 RepID=UPI00403DD257
MSFGKMRTMIDIIQTQSIKDEDGFTTEEELTLASIRAYKEDRHGNEAWKNRASFSTATSLFRFRKPRDFTVTTSLKIVCKEDRYNILSFEDLKERGMYLEVLAEKIVSSKG